MERTEKNKIQFMLKIGLICLMLLIYGGSSFATSLEEATASKEKIRGRVIIKYVNEQGVEIVDPEIVEGNIGDEYSINRKEISQYSSIGVDPINKVGNFKEKDVEVIFKYVSALDSVEITNKNNQIVVRVKNEPEITEYILKVHTVDEATQKAISCSYYKVEQNDVEINGGKVVGEHFAVGAITVNQEGIDTYVIDQIETPEGYEKIAKGNIVFSVKRKLNPETNKYELELIYDKTVGVEISLVNNEIKVKVMNRANIKNMNASETVKTEENSSANGNAGTGDVTLIGSTTAIVMLLIVNAIMAKRKK